MSYSEIVGQDEIKKHLKNAIKTKKISHAYLFSGEEGMGKLLMAKTFATSLVCEEGGEEMCGQCRSCHQASTGNHPDIIYFDPHDAPNNKQADYTREKIVGDVLIRPYQSPYKVYIISHAQDMSEQAQNIILKSIEEPPDYVVLIILTDKRESMLTTIRSRCVEMAFRPVRRDIIERHLMEKCELPDYRAAEAASFSFGNPGVAVKSAADEVFQARKSLVVRLLSGITDREPHEWIPFLDEMNEDAGALPEYLDLMEDWYRDLLFYKTGASEKKLCYDKEARKIVSCADKVSFSDIDDAIRGIEVSRRQLAANVDKGLIMFNLLAIFKR